MIRDTSIALSLDSRDAAPAYLNRGKAKGMKRDYQGAIADLTTGINMLPSPDPRAYYERGIVKSKAGDWDGAIEDFNQVLLINPNFTPATVARDKAKLHQL